MLKLSYTCLAIALAATSLTAQKVQAQIIATIDDPNVQASTVSPSESITETFNEDTTGRYTTLNSAIGTYTSSGMQIVAADQYGGAGGTGNYFAVGAESGALSATLKLTGSGIGSTTSGNYNYFGFDWTAGDPENEVQLYENSTLEYTFNTAALVAFINTRPDAASYYGNPNNRSQDSNEPFAYINLIGTNGTVFNTVVLRVLNQSTGFESDNHTIGIEVPLLGIPIVPEPGIWAMIGGLTVAGLLTFRKRPRTRSDPTQR